MITVINLGVDPSEMPYAGSGSITCGEVAEILEGKFDVMQIFANMNEAKIAAFIEQGIADSIESKMMGAPDDLDMFGSAMEKIKDGFDEYIDQQQHGIKLKKFNRPMAGARFKKQYRKVAKTLAFVDSGMYRSNFKAWVE